MADFQRRLAYTLLESVRTKKSYSNLALAHALSDPRFHGSKSFVSALFYGVLERQITLDAILSPYLAGKTIQPPVRTILQIGLYQLLFLDSVPDSAAVNESVELCAYARVNSAKGLVNAVLRRFIREGKPFSTEAMEPWQALSCPEWLYRQWQRDYGEENALRFSKAALGRPPLTIRVNTRKTTREALAAKLEAAGVKAVPCRFAPQGLMLQNTGGVEGLPGFAEGEFFVQDSSSQLAARLLGARPGETVYDVCAAPGSKSCAAALEMNDCGTVLALDIHENKTRLIEKNARRLGLSCVEAKVWDGRIFDPSRPPADRVLCDLPCSGYGVLRRKPEIRQRSFSDAATLAALQAKLLDVNCQYVRPGGTLLYCTCTLSRAENQENAAAFLTRHSDFTPDFLPQELSALGLFEKNMLTVFPDRGEGDGFFLARFRRR